MLGCVTSDTWLLGLTLVHIPSLSLGTAPAQGSGIWSNPGRCGRRCCQVSGLHTKITQKKPEHSSKGVDTSRRSRQRRPPLKRAKLDRSAIQGRHSRRLGDVAPGHRLMVRPAAFHWPGYHSSSQTCNRTKMMCEQLEIRHEAAARAAAPATCLMWPAPASYVASLSSVNCKGTCPPIDRSVTRAARHRSATQSDI